MRSRLSLCLCLPRSMSLASACAPPSFPEAVSSLRVSPSLSPRQSLWVPSAPVQYPSLPACPCRSPCLPVSRVSPRGFCLSAREVPSLPLSARFSPLPLKIYCRCLSRLSLSLIAQAISLARALTDSDSLSFPLSPGLSRNTFFVCFSACVSLCLSVRLRRSLTSVFLWTDLCLRSLSLGSLFRHGNQLPPWPPRARRIKLVSQWRSHLWMQGGCLLRPPLRILQPARYFSISRGGAAGERELGESRRGVKGAGLLQESERGRAGDPGRQRKKENEREEKNETRRDRKRRDRDRMRATRRGRENDRKRNGGNE